jgi:hypothetical protein
MGGYRRKRPKRNKRSEYNPDSTKSMATATYSTGQRQMKAHAGNMFKLASKQYPTLEKTVLEQVQNALDALAPDIFVNVNIPQRAITVHDNGEGVTEDKFWKSLAAIGVSQKTEDKLGRFGLGLISPLTKCFRFYFTSCWHKNTEYNSWRFDCKKILDSYEYPEIPHSVREDLYFKGGRKPRTAVTAVPWRTEVRIEQFTDERIISAMTIDSLEEAIAGRFGAVLRKRKVNVRLRFVTAKGERQERAVKATQFAGRRLKEENIEFGDNGKALFKLYHNGRRRPRGKRLTIEVGETDNDFRVSFAMFVRSTLAGAMDTDLIEALKNGEFTGEILSNSITLNEDRDGYEEDAGLADFCDVIEKWWFETGKKLVKDTKSQKVDERRQENGRKSLLAAQYLIDNSPEFQKVIKSISKGSIGSGHTGHGNTSGKTLDKKSVAASQGAKGRGKRANQTVKKAAKKKGSGERKGHRPMTVRGPQGQKRVLTYGGSRGLTLAFEAIPGEERMWEWDREMGVLVVNAIHPCFTSCEDRSDRSVQLYQEHIINLALTHESMTIEWELDDDKKFYQRLALERVAKAQADLILKADNLAGRVGGKKKAAKKKATKKKA